MSMIQCPKCGSSISDKANVCPHCGLPLVKSITCPECNTSAPGNAKSCPKCGFPFVRPATPNAPHPGPAHPQQPTQQHKAPQKPLKTGAMGIIGFIISLCSFLFLGIPIVAVIAAVIAIVLGSIGCNKKYKCSGLGMAGMIIGIIAMAIGIIVYIAVEGNHARPSSSRSTTQETTAPEYYIPGQIISIDKLNITFISYEDYTSDNMFVQPKEGYKYVTATFEYENTGKKDQFVSAYDFNCYADGYAVDQTYIRDDHLSSTISSGKKVVGTITAEVPIDSNEISFEYTLNSWTSEKIVFKNK